MCEFFGRAGVSILARPEGRALRYQAIYDPLRVEFQSSPAPKGGRYSFRALTIFFNISFNPRPPRRAGATAMEAEWRKSDPVSILARPEGRALPVTCIRSIVGGAFQSSPAPKGGRYPVFSEEWKRWNKFQSSPAPKGGRYLWLKPLQAAMCMFQSSPAPKGGRYTIHQPLPPSD